MQQPSYLIEKTRIKRAILFALLLHCIIFSLFFLLQLQTPHSDKLFFATPQEDEPIVISVQEPQELLQHPWAATEARQSIFDKQPDFDTQQTNSSSSSADHEEQIITPLEEIIDQEQIKENTPVQTMHETIAQTQKLLAQVRASTKKEQKKVTAERKKITAPITLAGIAHSYLDQTKTNGTSAMTTFGKKGAKPTEEQLKYERYMERLCWCLQNSFKQNEHTLTIGNVNTHMNIAFALNNDGSLQDIQILETSGNTVLDRFVINLFHDASSSFPPVPQYLPQPFTTGLKLLIELNSARAYNIKRSR